ncbi:hypothetical protein LCGC14_2183850 [marine sediment metagenome]|uniref:Uncharacterized protein n=1 Tax=marine sediment metagenome TaxID=412755 RepID=A0A0F9DLL1_9ZZZZ|nr:hypothetical protein [bacterium]
MRKLILQDYQVKSGPEEEIECPECKKQITVGGKPLTYDVRDSIIEVMMSPELRLSGRELLERQKIALRIMESPDGEILLEDAEYGKIESAFEEITGFSRRDTELVQRVFEAPEVEVQAVPEEPPAPE